MQIPADIIEYLLAGAHGGHGGAAPRAAPSPSIPGPSGFDPPSPSGARIEDVPPVPIPQFIGPTPRASGSGGHGSHGAKAGTAAKLPGVSGRQALPVTADDLAAFEAALAADRGSEGDNALGQNLARAASIYRGNRNPGPVAVPVPSEMRDWVLKRGLRAEDAAAKAGAESSAAARALAERDNAPAPEEWGAPRGLTRAEAVKWLGTKKEPKPEDPLGPLKERKIKAEVAKLEGGGEPKTRPTAEQVSRGKALGIVPAEGEDSQHFEDAIRAAANSARTASEKGEGRADKKKASRWLGPDFEFAPDVPDNAIPDSTRAKALDEAGLVTHVHDSAQKLRDLLKKHGPEVVGKAATQMKTLVEDLRLTIKDPVYNLGVLNGRDYELVSKIVSDPTAMGQILSSEAGVRDLDTALATAQKQWKSKVRARMRGYGAQPRKGGKYEEAETIRVRRKADGKEGSMPAENFNPDIYEKIG